MEPDFTGWATKSNLLCSDGRTILPGAFAHQDQEKVPLVWNHIKNDHNNVLGHAILEDRPGEGTYCRAYFNDTPQGRNAKKLVEHGDVSSLSIFANRLKEQAKQVSHGIIREVSLVIAGANPGAKIDNIRLEHSDGSVDVLEDEAIFYNGLLIEHSFKDDESEEDDEDVADTVEHAEEKTVKDVFDSMNDDQKNVVYYLIGKAMEGKSATHADEDDDTRSRIKSVVDSMTDEQQSVVHFMVSEALEHTADDDEDDEDDSEDESDNDADTGDKSAAHADDNKEGSSMTHNVFESGAEGKVSTGTTISHADAAKIFKRGQRIGSLREAVEEHATDTLEHGIHDIETLFPDAKNITNTPEWDKRRTEWVSVVLNGTRHTPFSRIKTQTADITMEEARAKGYVKGNLKKEEFFRLQKRVTTPQTIYKKQKLDRDDIIDITDFDVVAWLKGEMRLMLEEELARAILLGDGRSAEDEDKIQEDHIRPIATDDDLYATKLRVVLDETEESLNDAMDALVLNRRHYRGSGNPVLFTSETLLARMLLLKDGFKRRLYNSVQDLQAALRVSAIHTVEIMDEEDNNVLAIMVNLQDYTVGADRGGDVALFEDFDIDYNQNKYLIETRCSGALTKLKSALVLLAVTAGQTLVDPVAPTWNAEDKTVTVATTTGLVYKNKETNQTLTTGQPVTLAPDDELTVIAVPTSGY